MPLLAPVVWAERPDVVLITIALQDVADPKINTTATTLDFTGTSGDKEYTLHLDLKGEITPEESSQAVRPRQIELKLKKKEEGPYWEGLTKGKMANVKIDWSKWKDEDEVAGGDDFGDFGMGGGLGGMGAGMPGMGMPGMPGMGGGIPGMGDLGGMNLGGGGDPEEIARMMQQAGAGGGDSDDEDDDGGMPGLEKQSG
eukprot:Hpha_TRINITY_DN15011_c1_g5::TRINITY_DN15011_c1_g5_i1::g.126331::m.126331